jgi:hypothetical protein
VAKTSQCRRRATGVCDTRKQSVTKLLSFALMTVFTKKQSVFVKICTKMLRTKLEAVHFGSEI